MMYLVNISAPETSGLARSVTKYIKKARKACIAPTYFHDDIKLSDMMNITLRLSASPVINGLGGIPQSRGSGLKFTLITALVKGRMTNFLTGKTQA